MTRCPYVIYWSLLILGNVSSASAWLLPSFQTCALISGYRRPRPVHAHNMDPGSPPIIDADFERIEKGSIKGDALVDFASKSLLELSLESDPDWNETRIPFMDGENFIDVKLAFMVDLDGVQYGIGIPYDHAVVVTIEQKDGTVLNLSPEDEESDELIQIMASQVQEHVGSDLALKRTPRILTIKGPLEKYTKDWKDKIIPPSYDAATLLDESGEDMDFFRNFMRKELGEEEYKKTLEEDAFDIDDELLQLFGFNDEGASTINSIKDIFPDGIDNDGDVFIKEMEEFVSKEISHAGVALKLISYSLPDGNKYSVSQLLQPYALVGKYTENGSDIRFDLLSKEESELVIPRLEEVCQEDLRKAGLMSDNIAN